jgi:transcription initiation factor TFIID TATA-box-binding protein
VDYDESNRLFLSDNVKVSSIVYSVYLDQKIDIERTCAICDNCKTYQGGKLTYRQESPKATICMSKSGYIRSMGTPSLAKAKHAIEIAINELSKRGIVSNPVISKHRIENIVASGAFQNRLDLEYFADVLSNTIYEPEQFPAIIYRPAGKVVCLLFASGKFVIVGAKTIEEVRSTYEILSEKIRSLND